MAHLHTSLVLLCFFCSVWPSDGMIHFTYLGTKCIEDCKLVGHVYKCKSTDKDGNVQSLYCSPKTNTDYRGKECGECGTGGKGYYYCITGSVFSLYLPWGYCGLVTDKNVYYGSRTGAMCHNKCDQDKNNYWCNTAKGKDLCSPLLNRDYKNNHCREDSPCGKQGQNYYWCWLKKGDWGHCGPVEPKMFLHRSKEDQFCVDEYQYNEKKDYYWCHTANGWDYCSPDVDVTYKGKPCRSDHFCGLHGESYNWCWTSESEYDYCGPVESGECTYDISQNHNRGDLKDRKLTCTQVDRANKTITFTVEPASFDIADGSQWKIEAQTLIRRWDNAYLVGHGHLNLIHSYNVHINMKDNIKRNNQSYYELRMHLKQGPGKSPTVSQIIVPRGIPERYMRRAFLESFRHRARVYVDVSRQN